MESQRKPVVNRKPVPKYASNPYLSSPLQRHYLAYNVQSDYWRATVGSLTAIASRVLLLLPTYYDVQTASCTISYKELARFIPSATSSSVGVALTEMAKKDIVSRSTRLHTVYLNPAVWLPIGLTV